ncbi:hypothetical protein GJ496_005936 [Pomphorhynchus laevis]|nr:hypothetical protein GJ496_005936 [Pomphorhynchus laevis]
MKIPISLSTSLDYDEIEQICKIVRPSWSDRFLHMNVFKDGKTNILVCCFDTVLSGMELSDNNRCGHSNDIPKFCGDSVKLTKDTMEKGYDVDRKNKSPILETHSEMFAEALQLFKNKEYCLSHDMPLIVRIFGSRTSSFINRSSELHYIKQLAKTGMAAEILAEFENGLVYEYFPGITLTRQMFRKDDIALAIIRQLALFHNSHIQPYQNNRDAILFKQISTYLAMLDDEHKHIHCQKRKSNIHEKIDMVRKVLSQLEVAIEQQCKKYQPVMCHNDLLDTNIILNEETGDIRFIDFEYSGYNYASYDVANHFNEFAGISDADFSLIPGREEIWKWCQLYLLARHPSDIITDDDVDHFVKEVELFMPLSHLFWSLWAFLQSIFSTKHFQYFEYGSERFQLFWSRLHVFQVNIIEYTNNNTTKQF